MVYYRRTGLMCDTPDGLREPSPQWSFTRFRSFMVTEELMNQPRTKYQEKIIKNYYRNLDDIALQKAMEQVTELYLTEGKKREQTWKRLVANLEKVGLPADQIKHLQEQDDPALIAEVLKKYV